jgi:hypothetical protein
MATNRYLENEAIAISQDRVLKTGHVHKFGAVPAMSQNNTGTIWDVNDTVYPWGVFDSDTTQLVVTAANSADSGETVSLIGLDTNYEELSENVVATTTGTTTSNVFKRINRAFMTTSDTNTGNVNITKNGIVVARVTAEKGQTLMSVYTVPAGKTGYLEQGTATIQAGADATGDMFVRREGTGPFRVGHSFEVSGTGGQYLYDFTVPQELPAKTDIDIRATVRSNNARMTASFDVILIDD